ncbi:MAG TPA: hypothetical protein VH092_17525, partial [Urbifossiella sp.]|nr:hypothetical protein [Urbifossiella sp.]
YFVDPAGAAKKPSRTGAVLTDVSYGSVPKEQGSSLSRGRDSLSAPGEHSPATTLVAQWLGADDKRLKEWKEKAQACREAAAASPGVRNRSENAEEVATKDLAARLSATFTQGSPAKGNDLYQDLIVWSLREVNWKQVAEDLLGR